MVHDTNLTSFGLYNLQRNTHNHGNEWWIFAHDGTPVESWKTESRARFYLSEQNEFRQLHRCKPCHLMRCIPGIGFVRIK